MSRVAARIAVTLALVALGAPTSAGAQQASPTEVDLVRRIDSLLTAIPDTREYELRADLARVARQKEWERKNGSRDVPLETVRVGPLTVVAPPDQVEEAADLYRSAWSRNAASVTDASALLGDITFGFQISSRRFVLGNSTNLQTVRARPWTPEVDKEIRAAGAIAAVLGQRMPKDLIQWSGAMPLLGDRPGKRPTFGWPAYYQEAYRGLAIQPARAAALCFGGDTDSCLKALGLDADVAWNVLYTQEEIRAIVQRITAGTQQHQDAKWACLSEQSHEACIALVAERLPSAYVPLSSRVRISLLRYALETGGEGAFSRLISEGDKSISDRLEAASGMDLHDLVAVWRTRVIESRPQVTAGMPLSVVVALLWIGLMSFFGFRSTRWRTG